MNLTDTVNTKYGSVNVELLRCDVCGVVSQEKFAVGWYMVEDAGVAAPVMAVKLAGHFCGRECLRRQVS